MKKLNILLTLITALTINTLQAETITYYANDLVGSPVAAMDQNGTVLWRESYNPYGESRIKPSQNSNDIGFTGHQKDDATGLTYMQARYYDPIVGRFYGVDPIGFRDVHSFNRFTYANNNPFKYVDPDGQTPGDRFDNPDEAGNDAVDFINPKSISENKEFGGVVNREVTVVTNTDGSKLKKVQYFATKPKKGIGDHVDIIGSKKDTVGDYHTHGDYSRKGKNGEIERTTKNKDEYDSDQRSVGSSADSGNTQKLGKATQKSRSKYGETYKSYLGTPSKKTKIYSYKDKKN